MSYSFTIRAADAAEAKQLVAEELGKVVDREPLHARDMVQAQALSDAAIDLLDQDDAKVIQVMGSGSLSWSGMLQAGDLKITGASFSASAYLVPPLKLEPMA